jgi:hypothetical protein
MTSLPLFHPRKVIVWPCFFVLLLFSLTRSAVAQAPPSLTPGNRQQLHSPLSRTSLSPPLRSPGVNLRFSPDGKYLLFQEPSGVAVLSSEPLKILFHISTSDVYPVQFSAGSESIVLVSRSLSFATHALPDGTKLASGTLPAQEECADGQISPESSSRAAPSTPSSSYLIWRREGLSSRVRFIHPWLLPEPVSLRASFDSIYSCPRWTGILLSPAPSD